MLDLQNVGMLNEDYDRIIEMIERPQGVVLVTGPYERQDLAPLRDALHKRRR